MSAKPTRGRVLIKRQQSNNMTTGGIVIPEAAQDKSNSGTVVSVGPPVFLQNGQSLARQIKVGDTVIFSNYAETKVEINSEEFIVINESDILLVKE